MSVNILLNVSKVKCLSPKENSGQSPGCPYGRTASNMARSARAGHRMSPSSSPAAAKRRWPPNSDQADAAVADLARRDRLIQLLPLGQPARVSPTVFHKALVKGSCCGDQRIAKAHAVREAHVDHRAECGPQERL
jgi:hypothetical protein